MMIVYVDVRERLCVGGRCEGAYQCKVGRCPTASEMIIRRFLPDNIVSSALIDDVSVVLPYFRAAPERLLLRESGTCRTIFHLASLSPKPNVLRELLNSLVNEKHTYSLHDVDLEGSHPLHVCAAHGHIDHLELITRFCCGNALTVDTAVVQVKFPFPLVDFKGRSVAACAKVPIEWNAFGAAVAEAYTAPQRPIDASEFTVDDIAQFVQLKRAFVATPLPWLQLPQPLHAHTSSSGSTPSGAASPPLPLTTTNGPQVQQRGDPLSVSQLRSPQHQQLPLPSWLASPLVSISMGDDALASHHSDGQSHSTLPPLLSPSALQASVVTVEPPYEAFAAVVVQKSPMYVAQMICINACIQFDSHMFYLDTAISGPLTYRGTSLTVEYYRATDDPDIVLGCWRSSANPDVVLYICRRSRIATGGVCSVRKGGRARKALNALEASLEIYSKPPKQQVAATSRGNGHRGVDSGWMSNSMDVSGRFAADEAPPSSYTEQTSSAGMEQPRADGADANHATGEDASIGLVQVASGGMYEDLTITEAIDRISRAIRQHVWFKLRMLVSKTIRQVLVVKRFVRQMIARRNRCANLFFTRLWVVLEAVRKQLEVKKIDLRGKPAHHTDKTHSEDVAGGEPQHASYLTLNIPATTVFAACRRAVRWKDRRWHVAIQEVLPQITPLAVGTPTLQALLHRLIMDEWLVPTAERRRLLQQSGETHRSGSPSGKVGSTTAPTSVRHGRHHGRSAVSGAVLQCTPHSPIPVLMGTTAELKAMWHPSNPLTKRAAFVE